MSDTVVCYVSGRVELTLKEGESIYDAWQRCCKLISNDEAVYDVDLDIEEI